MKILPEDANQLINSIAKSKIPTTIQSLINESLEKKMREDTKIKKEKIIKGEINIKTLL